MRIADAQVHIWQKVVAGGNPQRPDPFSAQELLGLMDECGVDRVVLAPTSWSDDGQDGNDAVVAAVREYPDRFRTFGVLALRDPASPERVAAWRARGLSGFCLRFHHKHLAPMLTDGSADWVWPAAERAGVPVTVNAPRQLAHIEQIARDHPGLRIGVDHLALGAEMHLEEVVDDLAAMARCPNVTVKADGLLNHAGEPSLSEPLRRVFDAFGANRFFWGTDLTRSWRPGCSLGANYRQAIEMFTENLSWLTGADRDLVMGGALCAWLDWPA
jgi:predicted TIM-barrel fold metal-dependent hydrolase